MEYNFTDIEKKWQKFWAANIIFIAKLYFGLKYLKKYYI